MRADPAQHDVRDFLGFTYFLCARDSESQTNKKTKTRKSETKNKDIESAFIIIPSKGDECGTPIKVSVKVYAEGNNYIAEGVTTISTFEMSRPTSPLNIYAEYKSFMDSTIKS